MKGDVKDLWHVADSQTGYTAISRSMLARLDLDRIHMESNKDLR